MAIDVVGALSLVYAIKFVAGGIGVMPSIRHAQTINHGVGLGRYIAELFSGQLIGAGDVSFNDVLRLFDLLWFRTC